MGKRSTLFADHFVCHTDDLDSDKDCIFVLVAAGLTYLYYWWRSYQELNGITGDTAGYFLTLCEGAMVVATVIANVSSFCERLTYSISPFAEGKLCMG